MKTSPQRVQETVIRAARSPRSRWLIILSLATLGFASAHTLPLHEGGPAGNAVVELLRTAAAFYVAGLSVGLARASLNNTIHAGAIGAINGLYALVVSIVLVRGGVHATQLELGIGALLAAGAAMLGALAAATFTTKR
jgi:hypothetical protein